MTDWDNFSPVEHIVRDPSYLSTLQGILRPPLIFVPGFGGCDLKEDLGSGMIGKMLWPPLDYEGNEMGIGSIGDLVANDNRAKIAEKGAIFGAFYGPLHDFLRNAGYKEGVNYWVYAYDWTQSNRISGNGLAALIGNVTSPNSPYPQVDIINHSNGGLVTRRALKNQGIEAKVRKQVYIASPHYGAPKAYFILHPDIGISYTDNFIKDWLIDRRYQAMTGDEQSTLNKALQKVASRMPSVYELMPDKFYFTRGRPLRIDDWGTNPPDPGSPVEAYLRNDWMFPESMHNDVRKGMQFKEELTEQIPGEFISIYSSSLKTKELAEFNDYGDDAYDNFGLPESRRDRNGDGTVPAASAQGPGRSFQVNGDHSSLPNKPETFAYIAYFLLLDP